MRKLLLLLGLAASSPALLQAQLVLTAPSTPATVDFAGFAGDGFDPSPAPGQLDSDTWSASGFSDGDVAFGGSATTGDFARGVTDGTGEISGGIYSFDDNMDQALWIQPTTSDFTPGNVTLKLNNATGAVINQLTVSFDLFVLNDQDRSNRFDFSYSTDGVVFTTVGALSFTSTDIPDGLLQSINLSELIAGLSIPDGADFFFRWEGDDVAAFGSRDEFGLDNIVVAALPGIGPRTFSFVGTTLDVSEGTPSADLTVVISDTATCNVDVTVTGGTATDPGDYSFSTTTLNFVSGGPLTMMASVAIADDADFELPETITFELSNVVGPCILGASTSATVNILDNEDAAEGECLNLYISEYIEGSGNNKALEVYNPTDNPIDLSTYSLQSFNNGNPTPSNVLLMNGTLAPGAVYAVVNDAADPALLALADTTSTVTFYNGDDAIVLFQGSDTIDAVGEVGVDPGSAWPVGSGFTNEHTLVRMPSVKAGQQDWAIGATEWNVFPQDDFSNFGSHSQDACTVGCSSAMAPANLNSTVVPSGVDLSWSAIPGSVACQVNGGPVGSGSANRNIFGFELNGTFIPNAVLVPGATYDWRVRCACNTSPIDATPFSATAQFTIPLLRESEVAVTLFPNPATEQINVNVGNGMASAELLDLTGRVLDRAEGQGLLNFDATQLSAGSYVVRVSINDEVQSLPVVVAAR